VISIERVEGRRLPCMVHIADVTHYVRPGTSWTEAMGVAISVWPPAGDRRPMPLRGRHNPETGRQQ